LDDLDQTPPFQLAEGPGLHDADPVTGFRLVLLVVRVEFFHLFDDLTDFGCGTRVTVRTTIVLFIPLETTSPVRVLRGPRVIGAGADCCWYSSAIVTSLQFVSRAAIAPFRSGQYPPQQVQPAWLFQLAALLL